VSTQTLKELEDRIEALEAKAQQIDDWMDEAREIGEELEQMEAMGLQIAFVPDPEFAIGVKKKLN